mmetsp:Transcript_154800/g.274475  ORF Transcript_154800/g.274475 Transcript_154800/m.274475 type:complete len:109 (+) Transcript_154800:184-510(+)
MSKETAGYRTAAEALEAAHRGCNEFTLATSVAALHRVAKSSLSSDRKGTQEEVIALLIERLAIDFSAHVCDATPLQLSNLVWSLARLRRRDPPLLYALSAAALVQMLA